MFEALILGMALVAGQAGHDGNGGALARRLERAAAGLLVRSETDAPLRVVLGGRVPREGLSKAFVLSRFGFDPLVPVRIRSFERFLAPSVARRSWHSSEDARRAYRFRRLAVLVRRSLRSVTVFEVGETEKHVFVLGVTPSGECVGFRTFVVET